MRTLRNRKALVSLSCSLERRRMAIRMPVLAASLLLLGNGMTGPAMAQQQPFPPGTTTSKDGCLQAMPATPHQEEVLKGGVPGQEQPAGTGAATGATTGEPKMPGTSPMPETQHQQELLKDKPGGG